MVAITTSVRAPIQDIKQVAIDFANEQDAKAKAEWPNSDTLTFNTTGLGREKASSNKDWIQRKPFAVANSWRPPTGAIIEVKILPPPKAHYRFENGQEIWTSEGDDLYVRYSPDFKHWSSWQPLHRDEKNSKIGVSMASCQSPTENTKSTGVTSSNIKKLILPAVGMRKLSANGF
jgi:hypothetical protein